jgi:glycosyltransferase 2 family protein
MSLSPRIKRLAAVAIAAAILAAMVASLVTHGGPMLAAARALEVAALATALVLAVAYRVVNAGGWGMILAALGEPVRAVPAARVWLASEACRWLPGSLWSFGSRFVLASRRGVSGPVASASVVLELGVTVAAWVVIAAVGSPWLRLPAVLTRFVSLPVVAAAAAIVVVGAWIVSRTGLGPRVTGRLAAFRDLAPMRPDAPRLATAFAFYVAMGLFNGAILHGIVTALPGGANCPWPGVVAANAAAWLVGFFALFAPGGLVVREACLAGMLSAWMPGEEALAASLAWRLVQIVAEIAGFAGIAALGLPATLRSAPATTADDAPSALPATALS